eukprot:gene5295-7357_t
MIPFLFLLIAIFLPPTPTLSLKSQNIPSTQQVVLCKSVEEGSSINLECPDGTHITKILYAFYGSTVTTSGCAYSVHDSNSSCAHSVSSWFTTNCLNETRCNTGIVKSANPFGVDPCSNANKYVAVGVECADIIICQPGYAMIKDYKTYQLQCCHTSHNGECSDCVNGKTGNLCQSAKCPSILPGLSLGSLLLNSDEQLRTFSHSFLSISPKSFVSAMSKANDYLHSLMVSVDSNGDGFITQEEMLFKLSTLSIYTVGMESLYTWCASPGIDCKKSLSIEVIKLQAMTNFINSPKHYFDGSGILGISNMTSTYPQEQWKSEFCSKHLQSSVVTTWSISSAIGPESGQYCGYNNGLLNKDFNTDGLLNGTVTSFTDSLPISSTNSFKRIYCLYVFSSSLNSLESGYECSVGLIYDGTPIDLTPKLTAFGVSFKFIDTSPFESEFQIAIKANDSSSIDESVFVPMPPSSGCGRSVFPYHLTDQSSSFKIGEIREYGVKSVQKVNNNEFSSKVTTAFYRIPFLAFVSGTVQSLSNNAVENVVVSFCHIDPKSNKNDENQLFCPVATFTTDTHGGYKGEIRVSNANWTNLEEYFNITASYREYRSDCTFFDHSFNPSNHIIRVGQMTFNRIDFFDNNLTVDRANHTYRCLSNSGDNSSNSNSQLLSNANILNYGDVNFSIDNYNNSIASGNNSRNYRAENLKNSSRGYDNERKKYMKLRDQYDEEHYLYRNGLINKRILMANRNKVNERLINCGGGDKIEDQVKAALKHAFGFNHGNRNMNIRDHLLSVKKPENQRINGLDNEYRIKANGEEWIMHLDGHDENCANTDDKGMHINLEGGGVKTAYKLQDGGEIFKEEPCETNAKGEKIRNSNIGNDGFTTDHRNLYDKAIKTFHSILSDASQISNLGLQNQDCGGGDYRQRR